MRPTRSRVILGGAIGVIAAVALALALPGSGAGRVARRTAVQPLEQFTLTLPQDAGKSYQAQTDFNPKLEYRFVITGTTRLPGDPRALCPGDATCPDELWDAFYHYGGYDVVGLHDIAKPTASASLGIRPECWPTSCTNPFAPGQPTYPGYSKTHSYDFTLTDLAGHIEFDPNIPGTGSFTVEIFAGTETVGFAVTQSAHHVLPNKHGAFVVTTTKGLGQLVVPTPKSGESSVASTSEKGGISFSELKLSPKDVLLLTEDKLSLKVTDGSRFFPEEPDRATQVLLHVSVSKSANKKTCPTGSKGEVALRDGASLHKPDTVVIEIPACGLRVAYQAGKLGAEVAVAIGVE